MSLVSRPVGIYPAPTQEPSTRVFFFFSNRIGCIGSIIISLIATAIVLFLMGVF